MSQSQRNQRSNHSLLVESIVQQVMSELSNGGHSRDLSFCSIGSESTERATSLSSSERRQSKSKAQRSEDNPSKDKKKTKKKKSNNNNKKKKTRTKSADNEETFDKIEKLLAQLRGLKSGKDLVSNPEDSRIPPSISVLPSDFSPLLQNRDDSLCSTSTSLGPASKIVGTAGFYKNIASKLQQHRTSICIQEDLETLSKYGEVKKKVPIKHSNGNDPDFQAAFAPEDMRCLALVSHNEMKSTMKTFVECHKNVLKKFRLTGTQSTMTMLQEIFCNESDIVFGPTCSSGPLGGDAELVALMATGQLGGILFFQDPMTAHPHQADIECLNRQAQVHNTVIATTPTTAMTIMHVFRMALEGEGKPELLPSFFFSLQGPSVAAYKKEQMIKVDSLSRLTVTTADSSIQF